MRLGVFCGEFIRAGQKPPDIARRLTDALVVFRQCDAHIALAQLTEANAGRHRDLGLAAVPYGSQAGGFFTKWDSNPDSVTNSQFATEANLTLGPFLQATASDLGTTVSAVVVAWLLAQPYVTIPIVGCRTVDQLEDSLSANLLNLPEDVIDRLNKAAGLTATNEP